MVSSSHFVSATPSSSGLRTPYTLPMLQHEGSSHRRQSSTNFSNLSPSHGLQLFTNCPSVGPFPWGAVLQAQTSPAWVPHGDRFFLPANLFHCGLLSLHGSIGPGRSLLQHGLPTGSQLPLGIDLLRHPCHGLQVDVCSTVDLHGLQGNSLPYHGLQHELQGKSLCSDISSTSSPLLFH